MSRPLMVFSRAKIMKAFGRTLNFIVAMLLVFALCGGNVTSRGYACSGNFDLPLQSVISQSERACSCCPPPADCCPSEPVPSDKQPLDASASLGKKLTSQTLDLQPVRLSADAGSAI